MKAWATFGFNIYFCVSQHQALNQVGTPDGAKSFLRGAQIF